MPVSLKWYCEDYVLYADFSGVMTVEDMMTYNEQLKAFINNSSATMVHTIINTAHVTKNASLREIMSHLDMPERLGWTIMMGMSGSMVIRFISQVVSSSLKLRYREFETLDEAIEFLQKMDSTLPPLRDYLHTVQ